MALQTAAAASRAEKGSRTASHLIPMRTPTKAMAEIMTQFGKNGAGEKAIDGRLRIDAIKDSRNAGGEQQAEGAGGGEQAHGKIFRIAGLDEHRHEQATERKDGEAGAGESEDGADGDGGDGESAGNPTEKRGEDAEQPLSRAALHHEISGEREERDGREQGRGNKAVHFDRD